MASTRKPVSRAGNSYFARIYRDDRVFPRSFADSRYGSNAAAAQAANRWVELAEERLPKIPPKPELRKATVNRYRDERRASLGYYQVYLPIIDQQWRQEVPTLADLNKQPYELHKLHFATLDEEQEKRTLAYDMAQIRNDELKASHRQELTAWYLERDRVMAEIEDIWPEIKGMEL